MASPLQNAVDFLVDFGFFDVILPFILVFTVMYAILEKTKIFGSKDKSQTKNINAMISFVVAFFVVATPKIVESIQVSLPQVALILIVVVSFLLLAGSFMKDEEFSFHERKGWKVFLTFVVFFGVLAVFLNSLDWLNPILAYISTKWKDTFIVSLIFLGLVIAVIFFVVGGKKDKEGGN